MVARLAVSLLTDQVSCSSQNTSWLPVLAPTQNLLPVGEGTAPCLQISHWLVSTLHPVSCPSSAALMPADGTVENSFVKQSANGGNVDVENGDAACIAPVMVCNAVLCLVHVGATIVLPLLSCRPC